MKTATFPVHKNGMVFESLKKVFLYQNNYLLLISSFLLGSSGIAGGVMPFGAAFFAAALGGSGIKLVLAGAVLLGAAIRGSLELVYVNAACMLLFTVLCIPMKKRMTKMNIRGAGLLFVAMLFPQILLTALQGFLLYDILKALFCSFIAFVLYFIFGYSIPIMNGSVKKALFTGEEAISVAVTAALILSGTGTLQILGFSIRNILCVAILLFFSFKCGAGVGAATGAAIGLITSISAQTTPAITGAYALCGMLAGILGNLGKVGSALGFIMGNMILATYLNGASEVMLYLREIIVAVVVFFMIPDRVIKAITGPFKRDMSLLADRRGYSQRIRDITVEKLAKFSDAFMELSKTFGEIAETKMSLEKQDIHVLFDRVADRICSDCSLCLHCWERNFYDTYQVMFTIVESLEVKGRVEESDIPAHFLDKCARISEFVNTVNNMYELFKVGIVWKSKLSESRGIISRQFEGMARLVSGLADEINSEVQFMTPLEDEITTSLHNAGLKVKEITAFENGWGKYEIAVRHNQCGGARSCISIIEKVVSDAVGRKMVHAQEECSKGRDGLCDLKLVEMENLRITTGIARMPKYGSSVSGDSFTFMNSGSGKYTLALCDGMGSGYGASVQSKATVNMLESLLESGFDKDMAVSLVNSVLVLKSNEEASCTIDLSIVDLFTGVVEFIKNGAAPTYIKRGDKVDIIRSASLPAGILSGIEAELAHRKVVEGDRIIMVTDGIIDSLAGEEPGDRRLMMLLQQFDSLNPQQIADYILKEANDGCESKPCDDLTVLVAKVWKKPRTV